MAKMPVEIMQRFKIPVLCIDGSPSENVSVSSTAAATSAAPGFASVVRVTPLDESVYIRVGFPNNGEGEDEPPPINYVDEIGTAVISGQSSYFGIDPGMVISMITVDNAASGTTNVTFI